MKVYIVIAFIILAFFIAYFYFKDKVCYYLPSDSNPEIFGKHYWFALHDISNRIPCSNCKTEAVELEIFKHDLINNKRGKDLYDKPNFIKWQSRISQIKIV